VVVFVLHSKKSPVVHVRRLALWENDLIEYSFPTFQSIAGQTRLRARGSVAGVAEHAGGTPPWARRERRDAAGLSAGGVAHGEAAAISRLACGQGPARKKRVKPSGRP